MAQQIKKITIAIILSFLISATYSQNKVRSAPRWTSDKGYWMVESNIHDRLYHIVRFYNNGNELVYTEHLNGVKLNIHKRKTKMKLKKALDAAMELYVQHRKPAEIRNYVVRILK
jgi:hypothetical protein